jgi:multiple sugar transport system ATP-binding protein
VIVVERPDDGVELLLGHRSEGAVEQAQRLQARLHLVHGARRYRRPAPSLGRSSRARSAGSTLCRMATVVLDRVNKVYENGFHAIHDLNLDIDDGEFLVLVGPSGCGKSTALRMIAGLESISSGEMRIGDRVVNDIEPKDRDIAMVFQNYALYPHMTVFDNIGFALKLARIPKEEIGKRVRKAASILELEPYLDRKPGQLSGGQRQRVAMGRAIVRQPSAFLMDEPLSNLDAKLRVQMRAEIARLQKNLGVTTFYVTHDQVEAMTMGDRVAVIKDGVLQQVDTPQRLYELPTNVFVAAFIGSPSMNLFEGTLTLNDGGGEVEIGSQRVNMPTEVIDQRPALRNYDGQRLVVGIRPEDLEDASIVSNAPADRRLKGAVRLVEALGSELMVHFAIDAKNVNSGDPDAPEPSEVEAAGNAVARFSPRSRVHADDDIDMTVAVEHVHFFDARTHGAIWD